MELLVVVEDEVFVDDDVVELLDVVVELDVLVDLEHQSFISMIIGIWSANMYIHKYKQYDVRRACLYTCHGHVEGVFLQKRGGKRKKY